MQTKPEESIPMATCKKVQNYIFKFADLLGQGNFSKVYKATNEITDEVVAIKIVELNSLKSKKLEELLFSEIDVLKKLSHPNVLRCFEVFTSNRNCYIITELCNQGDLQSKLKAKRCFTETQADPFIRDIFQGLQYLAEKNVIHRDLKVANVFIHNGKAKIADFGFAKFTKNNFKDINIGSPIYMSPEGLIHNIYGPKTDVWSFGILIYELLHGETPFSHCKTESELKYNMSITIGWSQFKPELSTDIKEVMMKCLEIDEEKRITASELKKLAYFRKYFEPSVHLSPTKQFTNISHTLNDIKIKSPLYNDLMQNVYKSDNNFEEKIRFKTETQGSFSRRNQLVKESFEGRDKYLTPFQERKEEISKALTTTPFVHQTYSQRKFSTDRYFPSVLSNQNSSIRPVSKGKNEFSQTLSSYQKFERKQLIISTDISFRVCVNILHYCRLIYKHIVLAKETQYFDENQANVFKRWLAVLMKTISKKIEEKRIIYDGENAVSRQKKLFEVTKQYQKKYSAELNLQIHKVNWQDSSIANFQYIYNYFFSIYQMIDTLISKENNKSLLCLGHSIIMICESTKALKKCQEDKDYSFFQGYKEIEKFLSIDKETMDLPSYLWHRRKFQI